jgi:hypothetical protein
MKNPSDFPHLSTDTGKHFQQKLSETSFRKISPTYNVLKLVSSSVVLQFQLITALVRRIQAGLDVGLLFIVSTFTLQKYLHAGDDNSKYWT